MKKTIRNSMLLIMLATVFFACEDIIEKDISKDRITLMAPADNLTTIQLTHTFWWDWLEDAEQYNIQIVEGSFSSVTRFVLDSTVSENKFTYTLTPGNFEWRVRGENNGGNTPYTTFNFKIDSTMDISSLPIYLSTPIDYDVTNNDSVTFIWQSLLNADEYLIEIDENTWGGIPYFSQYQTATSFAKKLPEGVYVWSVQGRNNTTFTSTAFPAPRTLTVDTTRPLLATLILPTVNDSLNDTLNTFTWNQGLVTGGGTPTALTDQISFYSDSGVTIATSTPTTFPVSLPAGVTSYEDSLGSGTYYWGVRTIDAAGNISNQSEIRKVVIKP